MHEALGKNSVIPLVNDFISFTCLWIWKWNFIALFNVENEKKWQTI